MLVEKQQKLVKMKTHYLEVYYLRLVNIANITRSAHTQSVMVHVNLWYVQPPLFGRWYEKLIRLFLPHKHR